jgi:hypothetical protein
MATYSLIVFRGVLVAIGGHDTNGSQYLSSNRFTVFISYDQGASWSNVVDVADNTASYPRSATWRCVVHDGYLYLVHGWSFTVGVHSHCWRTSDLLTWTQQSAATGMPAFAVNAVVSHSDGKMYAFHDATTTNALYSSTDGATWTLVSANPAYNTGGVARTSFHAISRSGILYTIGGHTGASSNGAKVYSSSNNGTLFTEVGTDVLSGLDTRLDFPEPIAIGGNVYLVGWYNGGLARTLQIASSSDALATWTLQSTWTGDPNITSSSWGVGYGKNAVVYHGGKIIVHVPIPGASTTDDVGLYSMSSAGAGSGGQLSSVTLVGDFFDFEQNYLRTELAIKSADALYQFDMTTDTITRVTDADYPARTVRGIVYLDGFFFVMDKDGNVWNSAEEDMTSWGAADFIAAEFAADGGVVLTRYQNYVVAIGQYSTEFFFNAGNPTNSPLAPVQNGVFTIGCADGDTLAFIDDACFWVAQAKSQGQSAAKGRFVATIQDGRPQKISTPDIDRILDADDLLDVDALTARVGGHSYYIIRLGTTGVSIVFDVGQASWAIWTTRRDSFTHALSNVVTANGTATGTGTHSFADGDVAVISAFGGTHTALNGTYNVRRESGTAFSWYLGGTSYSGTSSGTGTATGWSEDDFPAVAACAYQNKQIMQDKSNGKLYEFTPSVYRDNDVYMDWVVRRERHDQEAESVPKFAVWADFVSDRASGNVMMRFSDDDCQNFSHYRARSLNGDRTRWFRNGDFLRRSYEVRITDNIPVRAERLELQET